MSVKGSRVIIQPAAPRKLTLTEKLAAFDPKKHGGEFAVIGETRGHVFHYQIRSQLPPHNQP